MLRLRCQEERHKIIKNLPLSFLFSKPIPSGGPTGGDCHFLPCSCPGEHGDGIHNSFIKGFYFIHHSPAPLCYDVIVRKKQTYFSLNILPLSLFSLKKHDPGQALSLAGIVFFFSHRYSSICAIRMARITATASSGATTMATAPLNRDEGTFSTTAVHAAAAVIPSRNMEL